MQVQYLWVNLLDKCEHDNVEIAHSPIWLFYTYLTLFTANGLCGVFFLSAVLVFKLRDFINASK